MQGNLFKLFKNHLNMLMHSQATLLAFLEDFIEFIFILFSGGREGAMHKISLCWMWNEICILSYTSQWWSDTLLIIRWNCSSTISSVVFQIWMQHWLAGFRLGLVCYTGGSVEIWDVIAVANMKTCLFFAQAHEALKLGPCILPFEVSAHILKVDVSIVKAHRLKPTCFLAEAVNMEMHVGQTQRLRTLSLLIH